MTWFGHIYNSLRPGNTSCFLQRLIRTDGSAATILLRLVVGGIFLSEGILKFLDPLALGAGRFARIGIPAPEVMGAFVGGVEIIGGTMLLLGLLTRAACIPMLISMVVAIVSTKGPVLVGHAFDGFALQELDTYGVWSFLHEGRTDLLMVFGLAFFLIVGAGRLSMDAYLSPRRGPAGAAAKKPVAEAR